jgi:hypothetical protein
MALTSPPAQKPRPAPCHHHHAHVGIGSQARHGLEQRIEHVAGHGVQPVRAVEGEQGDAVLDGLEQILGHRGSSGTRWVSAAIIAARGGPRKR